jgi:hypothetical protein
MGYHNLWVLLHAIKEFLEFFGGRSFGGPPRYAFRPMMFIGGLCTTEK